MIYYGKTLSSSGPKLTAVQSALNVCFFRGICALGYYVFERLQRCVALRVTLMPTPN